MRVKQVSFDCSHTERGRKGGELCVYGLHQPNGYPQERVKIRQQRLVERDAVQIPNVHQGPFRGVVEKQSQQRARWAEEAHS